MEVPFPIPSPNDPTAIMLIGSLVHALKQVEGIRNLRALLGERQNVIVIKLAGGQVKAYLQPFAQGPLDVFPLGVAETRFHSVGVGDVADAERIVGGLLKALPVKRLPVRIVGAEGLGKGNQGQLLQLCQQRACGFLFVGKALLKFLVFGIPEPDAGELRKGRIIDAELVPVPPEMKTPGSRDLTALPVKADAPILRPGRGVQPPGLLKNVQAGRTFGAQGPVFLLRLCKIIHKITLPFQMQALSLFCHFQWSGESAE